MIRKRQIVCLVDVRKAQRGRRAFYACVEPLEWKLVFDGERSGLSKRGNTKT